MKNKDIIIHVFFLLTILLLCGFVILQTEKDDRYDNIVRGKSKECNTHLYNAGKSLTALDAANHLGLGISCFEKNRSICLDNIDDEIVILTKLKEEALSARDLPHMEQEFILLKINRLIFEGGTACHKGRCSYNETVFMCKRLKDRRQQ